MISWPIEFFLSGLSGNNFSHYFISWVPVIAILSAHVYASFSHKILSQHLLETIDQSTRSILIIVPILLLLYLTTGTLSEYGHTFNRILFHRGDGIEYSDPVARFVRANSAKDEKVLIWGMTQGVNFLSRRESPGYYAYYPALVPSPYSEEIAARNFQQIETNIPALIVDAYITTPDYVLSLDPQIRQMQLASKPGKLYRPPYQEEIFRFIEANYHPLETINGFTIYQYNGK